jgi:hypothetical protein
MMHTHTQYTHSLTLVIVCVCERHSCVCVCACMREKSEIQTSRYLEISYDTHIQHPTSNITKNPNSLLH